MLIKKDDVLKATRKYYKRGKLLTKTYLLEVDRVWTDKRLKGKRLVVGRRLVKMRGGGDLVSLRTDKCLLVDSRGQDPTYKKIENLGRLRG